MGDYFWTLTTVWTLLCVVWFTCADDDLLKDLGLDSLPDVTKINISHNEYTNMMEVYLLQLQKSADATSIPKLLTFESEKINLRRRRTTATRLRFPVRSSSAQVDVQHSELRILTPPVQGHKSAKISIYQMTGSRRRHLALEQEIFLSSTANKWSEIDITDIMQGWLDGKQNAGLELECPSCGSSWEPLEASVTALVQDATTHRARRSVSQSKTGRTDCKTSKKKRCCRHTMTVNFKELDIPQDYIIQPKSYEAGFCKGRCPLNYNHATNHSRIQSLVHRRDNKAMPKVCCAPSKLEPLEILRINPYDTNKLIIEKWDNMRVLECACS